MTGHIFDMMTVGKLRAIVRQYNLHLKIVGYSKKSKDELIKHMKEHLSVDASGNIHVKNEIIIKTNDAINKVEKQHKVVEQVKKLKKQVEKTEIKKISTKGLKEMKAKLDVLELKKQIEGTKIKKIGTKKLKEGAKLLEKIEQELKKPKHKKEHKVKINKKEANEPESDSDSVAEAKFQAYVKKYEDKKDQVKKIYELYKKREQTKGIDERGELEDEINKIGEKLGYKSFYLEHWDTIFENELGIKPPEKEKPKPATEAQKKEMEEIKKMFKSKEEPKKETLEEKVKKDEAEKNKKQQEEYHEHRKKLIGQNIPFFSNNNYKFWKKEKAEHKKHFIQEAVFYGYENELKQYPMLKRYYEKVKKEGGLYKHKYEDKKKEEEKIQELTADEIAHLKKELELMNKNKAMEEPTKEEDNLGKTEDEKNFINKLRNDGFYSPEKIKALYHYDFKNKFIGKVYIKQMRIAKPLSLEQLEKSINDKHNELYLQNQIDDLNEKIKNSKNAFKTKQAQKKADARIEEWEKEKYPKERELNSYHKIRNIQKDNYEKLKNMNINTVKEADEFADLIKESSYINLNYRLQAEDKKKKEEDEIFMNKLKEKPKIQELTDKEVEELKKVLNVNPKPPSMPPPPHLKKGLNLGGVKLPAVEKAVEKIVEPIVKKIVTATSQQLVEEFKGKRSMMNKKI